MSGLRSFLGVLKVNTKIWGTWFPWLCGVLWVKRIGTHLHGSSLVAYRKMTCRVFDHIMAMFASSDLGLKLFLFCFIAYIHCIQQWASYLSIAYLDYSSFPTFVPSSSSLTSSLGVFLLLLCYIIKNRFYIWEKTGYDWTLEHSHRVILWTQFCNWQWYFARASLWDVAHLKIVLAPALALLSVSCLSFVNSDCCSLPPPQTEPLLHVTIEFSMNLPSLVSVRN